MSFSHMTLWVTRPTPQSGWLIGSPLGSGRVANAHSNVLKYKFDEISSFKNFTFVHVYHNTVNVELLLRVHSIVVLLQHYVHLLNKMMSVVSSCQSLENFL